LGHAGRQKAANGDPLCRLWLYDGAVIADSVLGQILRAYQLPQQSCPVTDLHIPQAADEAPQSYWQHAHLQAELK
jgi:hypothetical protein